MNQQTQSSPAMPIVVVTDLDGTLLDHHSYSFRPAMPALACLRRLGIPCILNSSKTFDEMLQLRDELNNTSPFVCENGGAVFIPRQSGHGFNSEMTGSSYGSILKILENLRASGFLFRGFNDMSVEELADVTGLPTDKAAMAKKRHASEPIEWLDDENKLNEFSGALSCQNLRLLKGGRFYHVMGTNDKSEAVTYFRDYYGKLWNSDVKIIALGDGGNDLSMLEAADYPIVIPGINQTLKPENPASRTATEPGPAGWNNMLLALLNELTKEITRG